MVKSAAVLQFDHVTKEYRSVWKRTDAVLALDSFNLTLEPGEIFGFLGPNGAGKTTAIHLAMGFMRMTRGSGTMLGQPFGHARTRRRVGFLPENVAVCHLPALPLVKFYGTLNGMRDPVLTRRAREMLQQVELLPEADRNAGKFSRGMLQHVGLAQAMVNDPDLLVLDEPASALDPLGRLAVRELLVAARNAGKTVFLSSHLLSEIEAVCDRIAILKQGKLLRLGATADLLVSHGQSEIVARGIEAAQFANALQQDTVVRLTVQTPELRREIERIWSLGGEVVSVNPVRRSLEDIFIELTSSKDIS